MTNEINEMNNTSDEILNYYEKMESNYDAKTVRKNLADKTEIKVNNYEKKIKTIKKNVKEIVKEQKDWLTLSDASCPHLEGIAYDTEDMTICMAEAYGTDYVRWHDNCIVLPKYMYCDMDYYGHATGYNLNKLTEESIIAYVKKIIATEKANNWQPIIAYR